MPGAFQFDHGGRTYTCSVRSSRLRAADAWWWFEVSGDRQRYAPFRAAAGDTSPSVRERVVAYYEDFLARRAAPTLRGGHFGRRAPAATTPATPATT